MTDQNTGYLYGFIGVFIFALTLPATSIAVPYLDPIFIGGGRALLAALFAAIILILAQAPYPNFSQLRSLVVVALGVVVGFPILSAFAMQSLPASHAGVVLGLLPLLTAFVGAFISGDRPGKLFWLCGLLGSLLVVIFAMSDSINSSIGSQQLVADGVLVAAVISAAIAYAVGGELAKQLGGWQVICWALVISTPLLIWPTWLHRPTNLTAIPLSAVAAFLYLALFSQLIGFFAWYRGLALGSVTRVSQLQLVQPFITIIASALVLGEVINSRTWVYALAVVACVALSRISRVNNSSKSQQ